MEKLRLFKFPMSRKRQSMCELKKIWKLLEPFPLPKLNCVYFIACNCFLASCWGRRWGKAMGTITKKKRKKERKRKGKGKKIFPQTAISKMNSPAANMKSHRHTCQQPLAFKGVFFKMSPIPLTSDKEWSWHSPHLPKKREDSFLGRLTAESELSAYFRGHVRRWWAKPTSLLCPNCAFLHIITRERRAGPQYTET